MAMPEKAGGVGSAARLVPPTAFANHQKTKSGVAKRAAEKSSRYRQNGAVLPLSYTGEPNEKGRKCGPFSAIFLLYIN